jgi:hypothetical protein
MPSSTYVQGVEHFQVGQFEREKSVKQDNVGPRKGDQVIFHAIAVGCSFWEKAKA